MIKDELKNLIMSHIGQVRSTSKGWLTRNCMVCHHYGESQDTRGRFGVIFSDDGISTNCFNCGHKSKFVEGGTLSKDFKVFLSNIGIPDHTIKELNFLAFKDSNSLQVEQFESPLPSSKWKSIPLPPDSLSIGEWAKMGCQDKNFLSVVSYMHERGIYDYDGIYWSPHKKDQMENRMIVPFVYRGQNYGYVARYSGDPPNRYIPKYKSHAVSDFVYNLDVTTKRTILTEGVLDAKVVNGMSSLGKDITDGQHQLLATNRGEVIILPDFDRNGQKMIDSALKWGMPVSFPFWHREFKDAAKAAQKYGRIAVVQSILDSVEYESLSIEVKWRLFLSERN